MAASRSVVARLAIDGVQGVITGFKRVRQAAEEYGRVSQSTGKAAWGYVSKHADQLDGIGTKLMGLGALGAVAMGALGKAAMDWESAWAGVTKTVDGSREQLTTLEGDLRGLAKTLPASHQEIAAVAEAAGQLGVHVDDVARFTETMINLGETTNLSAEEAAVTLRRLMNIMGTGTDDVDRLGSTIVGLGNSFATTEAEISDMALRIGGAATAIGLAESDVLAFSAALSSLGIESQAGGSAISRILKRVDLDVRENGDNLAAWAKIAGQSSEDFAAAWKDDAATAIASVAEGLGEITASGGSATQALRDLGIKGEADSRVMDALAGATKNAGNEQNLLRDALELAAEEWEANNALQQEAEKRYQTRAAQAQIAINSIKDEAITLGQYLLPALDSVLSAVTDAVGAFSGLPDGVKEFVVGIGGVTTAAALLVGGLMKVVAGVANAKTALATLGISVRTATVAMGAIGIALTAAGAILGAWMGRQMEATARAREYADAIRTQGEIIGETTRMIAAQQLQDSGIFELAQRAGVGLGELTDAALGSEDAMKRVNDQLAASRDAIQGKIDANQREIDILDAKNDLTEQEAVTYAQLRNANVELNQQLAGRVSLEDKLMRKLGEESGIVQDAATEIEQLKEATEGGADATDKAAKAAEENAAAQQANADAYAEAEQAASELLEVTQQYGNYLLSLSGSEIAVEDSIARLNEAVKENGKNLDITTEKGRANRSALDDLARSSMTYIETLADGGATTNEMVAATDRARDSWEAAARKAGMAEEEVQRLSEAYFAVPEVVPTDVDLTGDGDARSRLQELEAQINRLPKSKQTEFRALLAKGDFDAVERRLDELSRSRSMTISARFKMVGGPGVTGLPLVPQADGSVLDYYASGGIRERHVAQIAPAGSYRVWAEPETGGEAYIPLSASKRQRSLEIWRETGRRLGVQGYRDGAVLAPRGASPKHAAQPPQITQTNHITESHKPELTARVLGERLMGVMGR